MDWNGLFYGKLENYFVIWVIVTTFVVIAKALHWDGPLKGWIHVHKAVGDFLANVAFKAVAFVVQVLINLVFWLGRIVGWGLRCWGQELWYEFWSWRARRTGRRLPACPQFGTIPVYHDLFPKKRQRGHGGGHGGH